MGAGFSASAVESATGISVCCGCAFPLMHSRMNDLPISEPPRQRQIVRKRLVWFLAGAGVNYLLISTPFKYLSAHTTLPIWEKSACSFAVSTAFFFGWNYFINF